MAMQGCMPLSLIKRIQQMGMRNTESARIEPLRRRALLPTLQFMLGSGSAASGVTAGSYVCVAPAPQHRHGGANPDRDEMWQAMLAKQQTLAVAVQFDAAGRLWRARVQDGHVLVDRSDDGGASFGTAVIVNPDDELIAADGDARPKLAVAPDGALYVTYTQLLNKLFSGDIRFSRSLDGGNSFSAPVTINGNRDIIGHRFDAHWRWAATARSILRGSTSATRPPPGSAVNRILVRPCIMPPPPTAARVSVPT